MCKCTQRHIPDNCDLHIHFCENLNAHILFVIQRRAFTVHILVSLLVDAELNCPLHLTPPTTGMGAEPIDYGRLDT